MAALGWLMNLGFAGGEAAVDADTYPGDTAWDRSGAGDAAFAQSGSGDSDWAQSGAGDAAVARKTS